MCEECTSEKKKKRQAENFFLTNQKFMCFSWQLINFAYRISFRVYRERWRKREWERGRYLRISWESFKLKSLLNEGWRINCNESSLEVKYAEISRATSASLQASWESFYYFSNVTSTAAMFDIEKNLRDCEVNGTLMRTNSENLLMLSFPANHLAKSSQKFTLNINMTFDFDW